MPKRQDYRKQGANPSKILVRQPLRLETLT